jgi:hypothetical protein
MTFDNSKTIISLRIRIFAVTVIFLIYIVLTYIAKLIKYPIIGMSDTTWTLFLTCLYFLIAFYPMFLNYQYIYFSDDGDNIIIRYFTAGILGGKKNSVEINKKSFEGYELKSRFFGILQSVILFQKLNERIAKYPPVYISILTRKEKTKVLNSLYMHTPKRVKDIIQTYE